MSSLTNRTRSRADGDRRFPVRRRLLPVLGLLLVPLTIAGLLSWSLGGAEERLTDVEAAVVNHDEPVKVDGRLVPLGRQLAGKLVGDEIQSNYSWEFATDKTAEEGLRSGKYVAVVTIPKNFSAAATSFSRDPAQARQARIDVTTGERSRFADEAINRYVTSTAADLLGQQVTTTYLDNVLVGFNTLGDRLGEASTGASSLADGAEQLASGIGELSGGAEQLARGSQELAGGLGELENGAAQLAGGLKQLHEQTAQLPQQASTLADAAAKESKGVQQLSKGLSTLAGNLQEMQKQCPPGIVPLCNKIAVQAAIAKKLDEGAGQVGKASTGIAGGLEKMAGRTPELTKGIGKLADGAEQLHGGTSQTHGGATELADGAEQLSGGIGKLADGAEQLSNGSGELSSGLKQATEQLPTYPEKQRQTLADTVADPITTSNGTKVEVGGTGLPMYAVLALWVGALATFLVLRPVPARALESTRSSLVLTLRNFALPVGIAIAQGVLVAAVLGWARGLSLDAWVVTTGIAALAAVAFTTVNHALAAALGGAGRFVSMLVALVVVANGFVSAVPAVLQQLAAALPTGPALDALRAVATAGSAPSGGAVALLAVWALLGLGVSCLAVERHRTVRPAQLLATYGVRGRRLGTA
ncbi:putative membrane protein [Halopolyspora algeriensis]|uniref:Putative membrane protein n=1 Tax=Halopolyspora algeriensis TaxID=1500506 RepID=A0A368VTJ4_9ACTN|nr:YhgE/Pip family protein [Halopolyspora algeriensis]RCW45332.1 putative membrane protein [Halopolyspora algeriensis]TQM47372.1 putative membrane protein [Halopolyspora algeriensis]